MKFLFAEVAKFLCNSTVWLCIEYCCHAWAGTASCHLERLDKLEKHIDLLVLDLLSLLKPWIIVEM